MDTTHTQAPDFNVRPKPRNPASAILVGDWKAKVVSRGWVTPSMFNILGVLYSTVYMGPLQEAKSASVAAFNAAGIAADINDLYTLIERKWVTKQPTKPSRYKLTAVGSRSYDLLYYAEEQGVFPLTGPVPLSPDEILERRRLGIEEGGHSRDRTTDQEMLRHQEILRAIEDVRARQDTLAKVVELALLRLDRQEAERAGL